MQLEVGTPSVRQEFDRKWIVNQPELVEDAIRQLHDHLRSQAVGTAWEGFTDVMIYTDLVLSSDKYAVTLYPVKPTIATSSG